MAPFGAGQTATSGIISALGRGGNCLEGLENFIQTDASINRSAPAARFSNPERRADPELIPRSRAGGASAWLYSFNMAQTLAQQLIQFGEIKRGLLGN